MSVIERCPIKLCVCSYRGIWLHVYMLILRSYWPLIQKSLPVRLTTPSMTWDKHKPLTTALVSLTVPRVKFNHNNFIFKFYELIVVHTQIFFHKCIFPGIMSSWQQFIVYSPLNRTTANFCIRRALSNTKKQKNKTVLTKKGLGREIEVMEYLVPWIVLTWKFPL